MWGILKPYEKQIRDKHDERAKIFAWLANKTN